VGISAGMAAKPQIIIVMISNDIPMIL
jgi:hypothetical protein